LAIVVRAIRKKSDQGKMGRYTQGCTTRTGGKSSGDSRVSASGRAATKVEAGQEVKLV
jgi:hypothetical protein